jgi:micrococcal nuclease
MLFRSIVFLLVLANASCSEPIKESYKVVDGDTLILTAAEVQRLDLAYIDAPEREQPFGVEAKKFLKEKTQDKSIKFVVTEDKQLEIMFEGKSLNLIMVEQGYAWASPLISGPSKAFLYSEAQKTAVEHLRGLWGLGHGLMVAPWQWRQQGTEVIGKPMGFERQNAQRLLMEKQKSEYQQKMQQSMAAQKARNTAKMVEPQ